MSRSRSRRGAVLALVDEGGLAALVEEQRDRVVRRHRRARGRSSRRGRRRTGTATGNSARNSSASARASQPSMPRNATSLAAVGAHALEDRELGAARAAPRRPLVHDDGVAAQLAQTRAARRQPAVEQLGRLRVQRGQRRGRALQRLLRARRRSNVAARRPPSRPIRPARARSPATATSAAARAKGSARRTRNSLEAGDFSKSAGGSASMRVARGPPGGAGRPSRSSSADTASPDVASHLSEAPSPHCRLRAILG